MTPDDVERGTSPPPGGLAATDLADWRTVADAAAEIGCSKRTIERLAAARKLESRLRPTAGSPAVAVYNPDDVARIALERRPAPAPFVLAAGANPHSNGNGHQTAELTKSSFLNNRGEDPIRQLAAAFERFLLSPPSPPVAEKVADTKLFLTIAEAAVYAGLPATDIRRACESGELCARKTGRGGWRIRRRDLEAW
jgi:excisionase family DNA binding protein